VLHIRKTLMQSFKSFLKEEAEGAKLKHITHAEDRPLQSGSKGFDHAVAALNSAHEHAKSGGHSTHLSMKYDGSPSIVFGHHPETNKFFVASKSAFNKNPKINYTSKDVEKNHGHAPGLVNKLQQALTHLKKVAPKSGVYQGDVMFGDEDKKESKKGVSFTPNTITYTAKGDEADKVRKAKFGVVVHTQYHGKTAESMAADPHPDLHKFKDHPDVWTKHPAHDTSKINYSAKQQDTFKKHMEAAQKIHDESGNKMYKATEPHQGASNHLETYINHTVRTDEKPTAAGLAAHIQNKYKKESAKLKTPVGQSRKEAEAKSHTDHIEGNKEHYNNLLTMHNHLQKAKDVLVKSLESHTGGLEHHIDNKPTGPEGFVVHHAGEPTKLVNRKEFAKANLLKVRK
jgi:hypothetical protein